MRMVPQPYASGMNALLLAPLPAAAADWQATLRRVSAAAGRYFFLTRVPVVENSPSFAAWQKVYDSKMLHMQFNQDELLRVAESAGLKLCREVVVGDRPYIHNAPEQCELRGWIFKPNKQ